MSNLRRALLESLEHTAELQYAPSILILISAEAAATPDGQGIPGSGVLVSTSCWDTHQRPKTPLVRPDGSLDERQWPAFVAEVLAQLAAREPGKQYSNTWIVPDVEAAIRVLQQDGYQVNEDSLWLPAESLLSQWHPR